MRARLQLPWAIVALELSLWLAALAIVLVSAAARVWIAALVLALHGLATVLIWRRFLATARAQAGGAPTPERLAADVVVATRDREASPRPIAVSA